MRPLAAAAVLCLLVAGTPGGSARACTSFCFETADGPIFGTNLDLTTGKGFVFMNRRGVAKTSYFESTTGKLSEWVSEYGSVTFNMAGRELPWGGMNEAGLVVGSMQLMVTEYPVPDERPPLGTSTWIQYVLDTCRSVDDVIGVDSLVRGAEYPSHYLVSDAQGNCAAIEYLDGQFVCRTGAGLPVKALANAPYSSGIVFMEQGVVPAFNPGASVERVAAAASMMEAFDEESHPSSVDYALDILTETVVAPKKWWSNLFGEPYTRWSVVFDVGRREVHFRTVDHHAVRRLSLDSFDLSCDAPLLMLDVSAKLEGNVEQAFVPYDHQANLDTFRKVCDKLDIEVSKDDAVGLMHLFESFECAP